MNFIISETNKEKSTEIVPSLLLTPNYICSMPISNTGQQKKTRVFVCLLISLCLKSTELDSAFVIVSQNQRILILMAGAQTCSIALEHLLPCPTKKPPPQKKKYIFINLKNGKRVEQVQYNAIILYTVRNLTDDAIA